MSDRPSTDAAETADAARTSSGEAQSGPGSLPAILERLVETSDGDKTTVGTLVKAFGSRTFGPLLLIPAVIAVAPTGAIPGMSIVTGAIILAVSLQMLAGRDHVWLPERALSFEVPATD